MNQTIENQTSVTMHQTMENQSSLTMNQTGENSTSLINVITQPGLPWNFSTQETVSMLYEGANTTAITAKPLDHWQTALESTVTLLILLAGLPGHIMVIAITCLHRYQLRSIHWLLLSLSIIEAFSLTLYTPFHLYGILSKKWNLPNEICSFSFLFLLNGIASGSAIKTIIGMSRMVFSHSEATYIKFFGKLPIAAYMGTFLVCIILVLDVPALTQYIVVVYSSDEHRCSMLSGSTGRENLLIYSIITMIIAFLLPMLINAICYAVVFYNIYKLKDNEHSARDVQEVRMSAILMWTNFIICWIPFILFNSIDPSHEIIPVPVHYTSFYLLLSNIALDPYLYAFQIKDYQLGLRALLHQSPRRKSRSDDVYHIDFNDLGEAYDNNLQEMLRQLEGDHPKFEGLPKKENLRGKYRLQQAVCDIMTSHHLKKEKMVLTKSLSGKESENAEADGDDKPGYKWKRCYSVVRVRDVMNLHMEDIVVKAKACNDFQFT